MSPNLDDWQRLGRQLVRRRVRLGHLTRRDFARHLLDTGAAASDPTRIIGDLERGARMNYSIQTLAQAETWYDLGDGELEAILAGIPEHPTLERPTRRAMLQRLAEIAETPGGFDRFPTETLEQLLELYDGADTEHVNGR